MTVEGELRDAYATQLEGASSVPDSALLLYAPPHQHSSPGLGGDEKSVVDEVWREIVSGRKEMKEEEWDNGEDSDDEMMTLEDFLVRAGAVDDDGMENEDKVVVMGGSVGGGGFDQQQENVSLFRVFEGGGVGYGSGVEGVAVGASVGGGSRRGKRGRGPMAAAAAGVLEPLDKAAAQRQRRMIKNRESAARSRERKQAYQVELETLAVKLEEENELLVKEKEERTKERFKQLMENVIPIVEKRRPPRQLRRVHSLQW